MQLVKSAFTGQIKIGRRRKREVVNEARADRSVTAILKPSKEAIELANLLGNSPGWIAALKSGGEAFRWTTADLGDLGQQSLAAIKRDRRLSPKQREDKVASVRKQGREAALVQWQKRRKEALEWVGLVKLYRAHRDRINELPTVADQVKAAQELDEAYSKNDRAKLQELRAEAEAASSREATRRKNRQLFGLADIRTGAAKYGAAPISNLGWRNGRAKSVPRSALDPVKAFDEYYDKVLRQWQGAYTAMPELRNMPDDKARRLVLKLSPLGHAAGDDHIEVGVPRNTKGKQNETA